MNGKVVYWTSVTLSLLALLLLIANIALISKNRELQQEATQRQATINTGADVNKLNQSLAQALAEASVKGSDTGIRDLLASQGITIKPNAAPESAKPENVQKK